MPRQFYNNNCTRFAAAQVNNLSLSLRPPPPRAVCLRDARFLGPIVHKANIDVAPVPPNFRTCQLACVSENFRCTEKRSRISRKRRRQGNNHRMTKQQAISVGCAVRERDGTTLTFTRRTGLAHFGGSTAGNWVEPRLNCGELANGNVQFSLEIPAGWTCALKVYKHHHPLDPMETTPSQRF